MKIFMKFNEIIKILYKFSKLQKYSKIIINKNFQYISIINIIELLLKSFLNIFSLNN